MFIHGKSGRPAFLISQDETGVTYDDGGKRHCIPSHEFFAAYREATADDLAAAKPPAKPKAAKAEKPAAKPKAARAARKPKGGDSAPAAQSQPMQQPQASTAAPGAPAATVRVEAI